MAKTRYDVQWFAGKRKRPIGGTTVADSDAIVELNWPNVTPRQLLANIRQQGLLVSPEVVALLETYIAKGFGDDILVTRNPNA